MGSCCAKKKAHASTQFTSSTPVSPTPKTAEKPLVSANVTGKKAVKKQHADTSLLDYSAEYADFGDITEQTISLDIDITKLLAVSKSTSIKTYKKEAQNSGWQEKYYVHGNASDVVANVESNTHGCINTSVSEDIDVGLSILHKINVQADAILKDRVEQIASREQTVINQFIQQRENRIGEILIKGRSSANDYENQYRQLLEDFIKKLELDLAEHLDGLQKNIQADKLLVFQESFSNIQFVTIQAESARNSIYHSIEQAATFKRTQLIQELQSMSSNKTSQPLGYEQLRTLNLQIYSTVGTKEDGQGCDNIPSREKFKRDIDNAKPRQPLKRTLYIGNNPVEY